MDLSASPSVSAYSPNQGYAQVIGVRGSGGVAARDSTAATTGGDRQPQTLASSSTELSPASLAAQKKREDDAKTARKEGASADVAHAVPGFSFTFQDRHQVMEVHNAKGVLIYQVPSKGQLALIQAEDTNQKPGQNIRLTA